MKMKAMKAMKATKTKVAAVLLEVVGISVMAVGIIVELRVQEPVWTMVIATGALLCTCGGFLWAKMRR